MLNSARSAMKLGMFEEAMGRLEEILECGTTDIQLLGRIYMYYGRVLRYLKHETKALEFFEHELNVLKLTFIYPKACDSSRRIVELALSMGKISKAKRCAEDLIDYTSNRKEGETFVRIARTLLVTVCLEGYERKLEGNPEENKRLLTISAEQISKIKQINEEHPDNISKVEILMLEAKCLALQEKQRESHQTYQDCIDLCIKTDQLANVHRAYYEMALYAEGNMLIFIVNNLRSASYYVSKYGTTREVAKYKRELADKLLAFGNPHEAYCNAMEALELIRQQNLNEYLKDTLLLVAKCLAALGRRQQSAYFIVLGSVLTIKQDCFEKFYKLIDEVMTAERNDTEEGKDVSLALDASADPVAPNEVVTKVVVKLEHATNVETWRMVVNGIIEDQKRPAPVVEETPKENEEPMDFMDLICKMNSRMDDQRTAMPASIFAAPRPISAASKKTTKSHRILPGFRANIAKIQNMKFDGQTVNKLLKRSKKSKTSLHSTSTQGDDTRSDTDATVLSK
ncbi:hypothetical protein L5515_004792 [Caenorhabditis briggsae]|nr:hypothetical protein L3Y34_001957 [Caenorhabditis briggsae]UMM24679.1 hypothetical protein L5515_004792 [Caenorhabditis briggsae]